MKAKHPPKKLKLFKTTIAHLTHEQLTAARGGSTGGGWETELCEPEKSGNCTGDTGNCPVTNSYTVIC
ncbi:MAG: class I lanthipeptide [Candidatus Aminicenantes bacterium]|nr:MAG: class I lanthipeptide [Candidatus Aminicenantes bacterium]